MRYLQAAASFLVSLSFIVLYGVVHGQALTACIIGAAGFMIGAAVLVGVALWEQRDESLYKMSMFIDSLSKLNSDQMEVLGMQFPHIRYHSRGRMAKPYFEDTDVPIEVFHRFLTDCNSHYIAPQRNWQGGDRPEWAWIQIYKWLCDRKLIIPNSAVGNTSHHWINEDCYKRVMADYWIAGKSPSNVTDSAWWGDGQEREEVEEGSAGTPQPSYAYETDPLPHLKKVSGRA